MHSTCIRDYADVVNSCNFPGQCGENDSGPYEFNGGGGGGGGFSGGGAGPGGGNGAGGMCHGVAF